MIENVVNKTLKITILMDFELMFLLAISFIKHRKKRNKWKEKKF